MNNEQRKSTMNMFLFKQSLSTVNSMFVMGRFVDGTHDRRVTENVRLGNGGRHASTSIFHITVAEGSDDVLERCGSIASNYRQGQSSRMWN